MNERAIPGVPQQPAEPKEPLDKVLTEKKLQTIIRAGMGEGVSASFFESIHLKKITVAGDVIKIVVGVVKTHLPFRDTIKQCINHWLWTHHSPTAAADISFELRETQAPAPKVVPAQPEPSKPGPPKPGPIDFDTLNGNDDVQRPTYRIVLGHVSKVFGVPIRKMRSSGREKPVIRARQAAAYLMKEAKPEWSYKRIGGYVGSSESPFDHTTILHAVKEAEKRIGEDEGYRAQVEEARKKINEEIERNKSRALGASGLPSAPKDSEGGGEGGA